MIADDVLGPLLEASKAERAIGESRAALVDDDQPKRLGEPWVLTG
jgi:hypothetical protein